MASSSDNGREGEEEGKDLSNPVERIKISNELTGGEREKLQMNP